MTERQGRDLVFGSLVHFYDRMVPNTKVAATVIAAEGGGNRVKVKLIPSGVEQVVSAFRLLPQPRYPQRPQEPVYVQYDGGL